MYNFEYCSIVTLPIWQCTWRWGESS